MPVLLGPGDPMDFSGAGGTWMLLGQRHQGAEQIEHFIDFHRKTPIWFPIFVADDEL